MQGPPESPAIRFIDPQPLHRVAAGVTDPPGHGEEKQQRQQNDAQQDGPPLPPARRAGDTPQHLAQVALRGPKDPWFGTEGTPQTLIPNPCPGQGRLPPARGTPRPSHPRGLTGTPRALEHTSPTPITRTLLPTPPSWPSPCQPLASHLPLQTPPKGFYGGRKGDTSHPTCTWPHGDPQVTALLWGRALSGWGGPHSPCPNPKHHCAQPQPGCSTTFSQVAPQMPPLYVHIYDKTPKHEVYRNSNVGTAPYEQFKEPTAGGVGCHCPPHTHFLPPTSPSLACRGRGSPDKGTLQGTAQTQPRGAGGTGLGGAGAAQGPTTSTDTGDQGGGTGQNKQTNKQTSEGRGRARGTPVAPAPTSSQVPAPGGWQGCWVRLGLARMRRAGSLAPPKPSAQWQRGQDTIQRGGQASLKPHSCVWGCSCPAGVKGMAERTFTQHSQPTWGTAWLPLGAGGSRCALESPQAVISSSFILVGAGTGEPFLASSPRSQSFSCARLSSVMPWAASSARTLSR